jgi:hypothetical protein
MIIQAKGVWDMPQYINAAGRIYEAAPERCFSCGAVGAVQGHGHYIRTARERDVRKPVRVHRLLCGACAKTFSNIFAFLVPWRRYTARIIAQAIQRYLTQPGTSYRKISDELSALHAEADTLSHSTVWRWVKTFCEKAKRKILTRTQGLCLSAGVAAGRMAAIEARALKRKKKHYDEGDRFTAGRLLVGLSMAVTGRRKAALETLHFVFLEQHLPEAIFAGHGVRLLNPQGAEHRIF